MPLPLPTGCRFAIMSGCMTLPGGAVSAEPFIKPAVRTAASICPKSAAQKIFEGIEDGDPVIVYTLPGTESPAVVAQEAAHVVNLINGIGEVTLESEQAILTARKLYQMLSPAGQAQVANYDLLAAAEAQLAALKAQAAAPPQEEQPPQEAQPLQ